MRVAAPAVVHQAEALAFGVVLSVASIVLLAATTTLLAAALAAGAIFYYAVLYTVVFKRHTRRSTEFGGVPGAAPVLIGWAAVTGSLAWPAVVFFGVVFCWQMPHFWALALRYRDDYAAAEIPMLPVVAPERRVVFEIVIYSWAMVLTSLLLWPVAGTGWFYLSAAVTLGAAFLAQAHLMWRRARAGVTGAGLAPMRLFHSSNTYLALLFVAVAIDALIS